MSRPVLFICRTVCRQNLIIYIDTDNGFKLKVGPDPNSVSAHYFSLTEQGLIAGEKGLDEKVKIDSPLTTGVHGGEYLPLWFGPDYPTDQRRDDAYSACFDSSVLVEDFKILGNPTVKLTLSSDKNCGQITVRLSDINPDGLITRVTYGTLNLCNRDAQDAAQAVNPNEPYQVELKMDFIAQTIPKGHRMRIALSSSYFPLLWSAPEKAAITLEPERQILMLPQFQGASIANPFEPPTTAPEEKITVIRESTNQRKISEDVCDGVVNVSIVDDFGRMQFDSHGLWVDQLAEENYWAHPQDPEQTRANTKWQHHSGRDDWQISSHTEMDIRCDKQNFYIKASLKALQNDQVIFEKSWNEVVSRVAV